MKKLNLPQYSQTVLDGVVVSCLREQFRKSISDNNHIEFSPRCSAEVSRAIVEAEFDPQLDPPLYNACKSTINSHCSAQIMESGGHFDNVMECLKADFNKGLIKDNSCAGQVARRLQESLVDIHLDPV